MHMLHSAAKSVTVESVPWTCPDNFCPTGLAVESAGTVIGNMADDIIGTDAAQTHYFASGVIHPVQFKKLTSEGTATGIRIYGYVRNHQFGTSHT